MKCKLEKCLVCEEEFWTVRDVWICFACLWSDAHIKFMNILRRYYSA